MALASSQCLATPAAAGAEGNIMDPIGASNSWRWFGYENSWVVLDGSFHAVGDRRWALGRAACNQCLRHGPLRLPQRCVAASGKNRQLLSDQWIDEARRPTKPEPIYGYMNGSQPPTGSAGRAPRPPNLPMSATAPTWSMSIGARCRRRGSLDRPEAIDGFLKRLLAAIDHG